jgi:hypothetical protein
MSLNMYHINLIKIVKEYNKANNIEVNLDYMTKGSEEKFRMRYERFREIDEKYENMIAAYYLSPSQFYYFEVIDHQIVMTKNCGNLERKMILSKNILRHFSIYSKKEEIEHFYVAGLCYLIDWHFGKFGI